MEVVISVKFQAIDFSELLSNEDMLGDFEEAVLSELASIINVDEGSISVNFNKAVTKKDNMTDFVVLTENLTEAQNVCSALATAGDDAREMMADAIRGVPKIQTVATGNIAVVHMLAADPKPPARKRQSMIEQGFAAASATSMRGLLQSVKSREVSDDSGMDQDESDGGSPTALPSRRALVDGFGASRARGNRVECRKHLNNFKSMLLLREFSLAGAWRNFIDTRWRGRINLYDFSQACKTLGHGGAFGRGHVGKKQVWKELDVDNAGSVTLCELDFEGAEVLGLFYATLNNRYGSIKAAAKQWKLTGPRHLHESEWQQLLIPKGIVSPEHAEQLFTMLCACPGGIIGTNGGSQPAVTSREMQWLSKIGPSLPRPPVDRVSPGRLEVPSSPSVGANTPGGLSTPGWSSPGFGSPGGMLSEGESTRMESENEDSGSDNSNSENNVFMKLYAEALEHHERRKKCAENQYDFDRHNPQLQGKVVGPQLYDRLYEDHKAKLERKQERIDDHEKELQTRFNQEDEGYKKVSDKACLERLHKPKAEYAAPSTNIDTSCLRQYHLWETLKFHELITICRERVEKLQEQSPGKNISFDPWGKSRPEIINFLKLHAENATAPSQAPEHLQKLFENAKEKTEALEKKAIEHQAGVLEAEKQHWICDEHKGSPHKKCKLCNRWQAIESGKVKKPEKYKTAELDEKGWERLYEAGTKKMEALLKVNSEHFWQLLEEADKIGMLHGKSVRDAKLAMIQQFGDDIRWKSVKGVNRDSLIAEALEKFKQKRKEAADKGEAYGNEGKVDKQQHTFFRLYLDAEHNKTAREEKQKIREQKEARDLNTLSIHRLKAPVPGVFDRLFSGATRESRKAEKARKAAEDAESGDDLVQKLAGQNEPQVPKSKGMQRQMMAFSFPEADWPPSQYFEFEFRSTMEKLGAPTMHQFSLRMRESIPNGGGVTVEMKAAPKDDKSFAQINKLALDKLSVTGCHVAEVWMQEAPEDPIGDFVEWICEKFNSLEEAFFAIDQTQSKTISRAEFKETCRSKGFRGNEAFVWHALDSGLGSLDMKEWMCLQPYVAHKASIAGRVETLKKGEPGSPQGKGKEKGNSVLVEFATALASRFPNLNAAWNHFNQNDTGTLQFAEFQKGARTMGWTSGCRDIFQELDVQKRRTVGREDFQTLSGLLSEENAGFGVDPYDFYSQAGFGKGKSGKGGKGKAAGKSWDEQGGKPGAKGGKPDGGKGAKGVKGFMASFDKINAKNDTNEAQAEASTSLALPVKAGSTTLEIVSSLGFKVGRQVVIDVGAAKQEVNIVKGFGSILLQTPLKYAHPAGVSISMYEAGANIGSPGSPKPKGFHAGYPTGDKSTAGKGGKPGARPGSPGAKGKGKQAAKGGSKGKPADNITRLPLNTGDEVVVYGADDPAMIGEAVKLKRWNFDADCWEVEVLTGGPQVRGRVKTLPEDSLLHYDSIMQAGYGEYVSKDAKTRLNRQRVGDSPQEMPSNSEMLEFGDPGYKGPPAGRKSLFAPQQAADTQQTGGAQSPTKSTSLLAKARQSTAALTANQRMSQFGDIGLQGGQAGARKSRAAV